MARMVWARNVFWCGRRGLETIRSVSRMVGDGRDKAERDRVLVRKGRIRFVTWYDKVGWMRIVFWSKLAGVGLYLGTVRQSTASLWERND